MSTKQNTHARRILAITALAFGLVGAANAQPHDRHDGPGRGHDRAHGHPHRGGPPPGHHLGPDRRPVVVVRPAPRPHPGRGIGPDWRYHRGDRLPPGYRGHQYVVDNWRVHHLSPPPRGHRWVQLGADYALIAIATGVITQIILAQ